MFLFVFGIFYYSDRCYRNQLYVDTFVSFNVMIDALSMLRCRECDINLML